MKKLKTHKAYAIFGVQIAFLVLVAIWGLFFGGSAGEKEGFACEEMRDGWTVLYEDGTKEAFDVLPEYIRTNGSNELVIQRELGTIEPDYNTVGIFVYQQQVSAYLEEEEILSFIQSEGFKSEMPGNSWKFMKFDSADSGKTLSIKIKQCYEKDKVMLPVLYKGTSEGIMSEQVKEALPHFLISLLGVTIGVMLSVLYVLAAKKNIMLGKGLPWLGLFSIFIGIWSLIEINVYSFFFDNLLLFSNIGQMSLKMCIVPFIMFDNVTFRNGKSKMLNALAGISIAEFWITSILQLAGIVDYADTIIITHCILIVLAVVVATNCVKDIVAERRDKKYRIEKRTTYLTHSVFMIVIIATTLADLYKYYFTNDPDIASFSRIGYLGYIIMVVLALLLDFMKWVSIGKQAEDIKEEASMDAMTKLWNRACFERDIDKPSPKKRKKMGILMFDLNNFKTFNDNYGHDMGDYYIKVCSEVLRDSFCKWGNVYRIGGDEFCGIAENLSVEEFERVKQEMESQIKQLRIPNYELTMQIASGFCRFDEKLDMSLRDTMKRADLNMYERKQRMKQEDREEAEE